MINFDDVTKENIREHNPNWTKIPYHQYRMFNWRLWIRKNKIII